MSWNGPGKMNCGNQENAGPAEMIPALAEAEKNLKNAAVQKKSRKNNYARFNFLKPATVALLDWLKSPASVLQVMNLIPLEFHFPASSID